MTMNMSRRFFLGGVLALSASPLLPKISLAQALPIIKADGKFDDWAGLQALLRGEPFEVQAEGITAIEGLLSKGIFRVSKPLELFTRSFEFNGCTFVRRIGDEDMLGNGKRKSLFQMHDAGIVVRDTQIAVLGNHDDILVSDAVIDEWKFDPKMVVNKRPTLKGALE